jgi:DNA-binding beta-propeller fold protein YncE
VSLNQAASQDVIVNYSTVDGVAKAGSDYTGVTNGTIRFTPGQTSQTIEILLRDDIMVEGPEAFTVQINSTTNARIGTAVAIGNIADNDGTYTPPPLIQASVVKVASLTSAQFKAVDETGYGSGDASGVAYVPSLQKLFIVDSEHDESPYFSSDNMFSIGPNGAVESYDLTGFTNEPTGIGFNPKNGYLYVTDDDQQEVFWFSPTAPSVKLGQFDTRSAGLTDTEDPKFDPVTGNIFVLDGSLKEILELTEQGAFVNSLSLPSVMTDAEALAYDPMHDVFFVASGASTNIWEIDRSGNILATISVLGSSSYLNPVNGSKPAPKGLELAPSSDPDDGSTMNLFVADYGIDQQNDGRLFEISLGNGWLIA